MSNYSQIKLRWTLVFILAFSAAGAQNEGNILTSEVGGSVTFPAPVLNDASLLFGLETVVLVVKGTIHFYIEDFRSRLLWDNKTGQFTIRELRINDTGTYTVRNVISEQDDVKYHLGVYSPVSLPHISNIRESKSRSLVRETCLVLCSVENGRDVTLSWYRGKERLNQSSSADLSRNLSLSLVLEEKEFYSCVAENPVSKKSVRLNACSLLNEDSPEQPENANEGRLWVTTIVAVLCAIVSVVVIMLAVYLKRRKPGHSQQQDSDSSERDQAWQEEEVTYTDVTFVDKGSKQSDLPELGPGPKRQNLTTVYDQLEVHRIRSPSPTPSNRGESSQS